MSVSEEWPEFVTPEAIERNTGVKQFQIKPYGIGFTFTQDLIDEDAKTAKQIVEYMKARAFQRIDKPRLRWRHRAWGDWMVERRDGARACAESQEGEGITIRAEEARLYAFANGEIWP